MGLLDELMSQMGGSATETVGRQLGVDTSTASSAIGQALPAILAGLARNTQSGGGDALAGALDRDHDGSILDDLSGYLDRGPGEDGAGILKHVFGGAEPQVEAALGSATNLDAGSATKLLQMLAPIVMGAMGRQKRSGGLDASGLDDLLGSERQSIERSAGGGLDMLTSILDADGDGSIVDDLADKGKDLLGGFLKGR